MNDLMALQQDASHIWITGSEYTLSRNRCRLFALEWTSYRICKIAHAPGKPGTFSPPLTSKETAS